MFDSPWVLDRVFCRFALKHPLGGSAYRTFALVYEVCVFAVIFLVTGVGDVKERLLHSDTYTPVGWQVLFFIAAAVTLILLWLLPALYCVARKEHEKTGEAQPVDPAVPMSHRIYRLCAKLAPNGSRRLVYGLLATLFTVAVLLLLGCCLAPTLDETVKEALSRDMLFLGVPCAVIIAGAALFSALTAYAKVGEAAEKTD